MAKLLNGIEYNNNCFDPAFGDFLIVNGYHCHPSKDTLFFIKGNYQLVIRKDNADLFMYSPEEEGYANEKWIFQQSHTGILRLDLFSWILLMHTMNVIKINDFVKAAKGAGYEFQLHMKSLFNETVIHKPILLNHA